MQELLDNIRWQDLLEKAQFRPLHGVLVVLIFVAIWRTSKVVYRLVWHPLAKFPGPRIAAATNLYCAYYDCVVGGTVCKKVAELHDKYGSSRSADRLEFQCSDAS